MTDIYEDSILKGAEYVELVGLFFNKEKEATEIITRMIHNYECAKDQLAKLANEANEPAKVLYTSYYGGSWSIPTCPNWYCEIIQDAGAHILTAAEVGMEGELESWGTKRLSTRQV